MLLACSPEADNKIVRIPKVLSDLSTYPSQPPDTPPGGVLPYLIAILSAGLEEPAAIMATASFCYTDTHQDVAAWAPGMTPLSPHWLLFLLVDKASGKGEKVVTAVVLGLAHGSLTGPCNSQQRAHKQTCPPESKINKNPKLTLKKSVNK